MQKKRMKWLMTGAAVLAVGCAPPASMPNDNTMTSGGDVALSSASGAWLDSAGGVWVEPTGVMLMSPGGAPIADLDAAMMRMMTDENIAGHLAAGDSLEIALSAAGAGRGQNADVRNFAQRMVSEHTAHLGMAKMMLKDANITPMSAAFDTTDAAMGARMLNRTASSGSTADPDFDRKFMGSQVALHQHMLAELEMLRSQASPALQPMVNETRQIVRAHLSEARALYGSLGGKR